MAQSLCLLGLPDTQAWTQPVLISNSITQIKAEKYHEIQAVHLEALFASVQYACTVHALCARHSTRCLHSHHQTHLPTHRRLRSCGRPTADR